MPFLQSTLLLGAYEYLKNKNEFYDGVRCSTLKDLVKQENTHLPTYAYFDGVYF